MTENAIKQNVRNITRLLIRHHISMTKVDFFKVTCLMNASTENKAIINNTMIQLCLLKIPGKRKQSIVLFNLSYVMVG